MIWLYEFSICCLSWVVGCILRDLTLCVMFSADGGDLSIFIHSINGLGRSIDFISSSLFIWDCIVCLWSWSVFICESISSCICGGIWVVDWKCLYSRVFISSDAFTSCSLVIKFSSIQIVLWYFIFVVYLYVCMYVCMYINVCIM